ncbi:FapA family protein [Geobacter sp.]|uniref:FapA family protein n=1 Tax=Geobacter sp. TaxID=46610 RepID=UPI002612B283|nr:FapA family protein [Geobacter sp.]
MADVGQQNRADLTFTLTREGQKLQACFTPPADGEKTPLTRGAINQALLASGYANHFVYDNALEELLSRCNTDTQPFTVAVGERRDGTFTIQCSHDGVEAYLAITPPFGGAPVTLQQVLQGLKAKNIVTGIRYAEIEATVASGRPREILAACGLAPEAGTDGELVSLLPAVKERKPGGDDDDSIIDYRNRGEIVSVAVGTPLMRRIPPVPGTAGESVFGKEIPPPPVADVQFAQNPSGAEVSPDDPNLLVAAVAGQPILAKDCVTVEPIIKVKNVDLSSGNLSFIGSIAVTGDITAGMTVQASGDISVGGVIEAAKVEAGGNIGVSGGIIGQGEVRSARGELGEETAHVSAKGSVTALFVENAVVAAGADITIQGFAMQSELSAGNRIAVGQEGSQKGHIIGGSCQAVNEIQAVTLGSHAGVHTLVSVGVDPSVREKLSTVKLKLQEKERELDEVTKRLSYFADAPSKATPEQLGKAWQSRDRLATDVAELAGEKKRLQKRLERVANARIHAERAVLGGVIVSIGTKALQIDEDLGPTTFRLEEGELVASS